MEANILPSPCVAFDSANSNKIAWIFSIVLSLIIGMPMNPLTIIGVVITAIGSAIVIKTLSTLKKIQVDIVE